MHSTEQAKQPTRRFITVQYPGSGSGDKTALTGIRGSGDLLYIAGFYVNPSNNQLNTAFVYRGTVAEFGAKSNWYPLNYPSSTGVTVTGTNLYGPDIVDCDTIRVVGSYTTQETGSAALGCMYEGNLDGSGKWTTLKPSDNTANTIAHSVSGGVVVGNYDNGSTPQGFAFVYDIHKKKYYTLSHKNVTSITAYGVYHNGGHSYSICGGFSAAASEHSPYTGSAMIVNWNNARHKITHWQEYNYNNGTTQTVDTHFEGITPRQSPGEYNLVGESADNNNVMTILFAQTRNGKPDCHGNNIKWFPFMVPGSATTTGNSVYQDQVIGAYTLPNDGTLYGYISGYY